MEMVEVQYSQTTNLMSDALVMPFSVRDELDARANSLAAMLGLSISRREYKWLPGGSAHDPLAQRAMGALKFWLLTPASDVERERNRKIVEGAWIPDAAFLDLIGAKKHYGPVIDKHGRPLNLEFADFSFYGKPVRYVRVKAGSFTEENFK